MPDDATVAQLLWSRSPDLVEARARDGDGARRRCSAPGSVPTRRWTRSWNTIPVGPKNPPGLSSPLKNVPNYAHRPVHAGRDRQARPAAARGAQRATRPPRSTPTSCSASAGTTCASAKAEVAAGQVRVAALERSGDRRARAHPAAARSASARGDVAGPRRRPRRARREQVRREPERRAPEAGRGGARVRRTSPACRARRSRARPGVGLPRDRPRPARTRATSMRDPTCARWRRSEAARDASLAAGAQPAHSGPDVPPRLRARPVHDLGQPANSLFAGVVGAAAGVRPRPGRRAPGRGVGAMRRAARARSAARPGRARRRRARSRRRATPPTGAQALETSSLPLARRLVDTLQSAVQQGGASLGELLLARRTLGELLLDAADVQLLSFRVAAEHRPRRRARSARRRSIWRPPRSVRRSRRDADMHNVSPVPELRSASHRRSAGPARRSMVAARSRWRARLVAGCAAVAATRRPSRRKPPSPADDGHARRGRAAVGLPRARRRRGAAGADAPPRRPDAWRSTRSAAPRLSSPLPGRVDEVRVRLGDQVKAGDRLVAVRSGALADLDRELESARSEVAAKTRVAERAARAGRPARRAREGPARGRGGPARRRSSRCKAATPSATA